MSEKKRTDWNNNRKTSPHKKSLHVYILQYHFNLKQLRPKHGLLWKNVRTMLSESKTTLPAVISSCPSRFWNRISLKPMSIIFSKATVSQAFVSKKLLPWRAWRFVFSNITSKSSAGRLPQVVYGWKLLLLKRQELYFCDSRKN